MWSDLLTMIGISRNASLDEIFLEAQKAEEILCRRNKEIYGYVLLKQVSFQGVTPDDNRSNVNDYIYRRKPLEIGTKYDTNNGEFSPETRKNRTTKQEYRGKSQQTPSYNPQVTDNWNIIQKTSATKCYNCRLGHLARNCPKRHPNNDQMASSKLHQKTS